jgi:hypothetical protein
MKIISFLFYPFQNFFILYPESINGKVLKEKSEQEKNTQRRRPFCPKHLKRKNTIEQ